MLDSDAEEEDEHEGHELLSAAGSSGNASGSIAPSTRQSLHDDDDGYASEDLPDDTQESDMDNENTFFGAGSDQASLTRELKRMNARKNTNDKGYWDGVEEDRRLRARGMEIREQRDDENRTVMHSLRRDLQEQQEQIRELMREQQETSRNHTAMLNKLMDALQKKT
ncbi:hypothetical protein BGX28_010187 [Mortierella sp. GBA30]|nr:hypothetical protein BGX28_010187 [Mortierella sp. GBA30]